MMKRNQSFVDERKSKKRKTLRAAFLPSTIPAELLSKILAYLNSRECGKLVLLNREWYSKIWSFLTSFSISVRKNGHLVDRLVNVTALEVLQFEQNDDYSPIVGWVKKFTRLRNLKLLPPIEGSVAKIARLVPSLTSLTVEYSTKFYEFLEMTNLRALSVQSEDFSIMKGLVNMHKLNTLHINAVASTNTRYFNYVSILTALTHLTLQRCNISEQIFLHVTALTNLKELAFIDRSFFVDNENQDCDTVDRIRELTVLRNLEVLDMECMVIKDDFIEFKKLTRLSIAQIPPSIELPPNLKSLQVNAWLETTIDNYVDKFINLESLDLQFENNETSDTLDTISKLKQLTMLTIMGPYNNKIEKGLNALTLLPRLKVLKFWMPISKKTFTADLILQIISNIPSLSEFHCDNGEHLANIQEKVPYILCK